MQMWLCYGFKIHFIGCLLLHGVREVICLISSLIWRLHFMLDLKPCNQMMMLENLLDNSKISGQCAFVD